MSNPEFYRYIDSSSTIHLDVWYGRRETPKGWWIAWDTYIDKKYWKWVSKTSRKRFAYPTREEAWTSFRLRKDRQNAILQQQLETSNELLKCVARFSKAPSQEDLSKQFEFPAI